MAENEAFIELSLRSGRLRAGLRNVQNTFKRTMGNFVRFTNSAFNRIRRIFFSFKTWATLAAGAFTANIFMKEADKYKAAVMGLVSVAQFNGIPALEAMGAAAELAADGLISIGETSLALKNLFARGFGLEESILLLERFKDSAVFGRQGSLELGQAVVSATEGLKNENSILVDNAGVTKNVSIMWKEYAAQIGTTVTQLTKAQKREAEIQGILHETEAMVGNAVLFTKTWAGQVAALGTQAKVSMAEIGTAMQAVLGEMGILDTLKAKLQGVSDWFKDNKTEIIEWSLLVGDTFKKLPEIVDIAWTAIKEIFDASWNALIGTARLAWQRILLDPEYIGNLIVGLGDLILDGISNILLSAIVGFKNLGAIIITPLIGLFDILGKGIGTGIFNGLQTAKVHINTFIKFINDKMGTNLGLLDVQKQVVVNYAVELQKTVAATNIAIKSQLDITKEEAKTALDIIISSADEKAKLLAEILQDPLITKNWEQGSKKIIDAMKKAADKMQVIMNQIKSSAKETGQEIMESLGATPGGGQAPRDVSTQGVPDPGITKAKLKTISDIYKEHATKILNSDSFVLEQKKALLEEEKAAFISLGGSKIEGEKLFAQVTMEVQRQRFQELIDLNQTSEATMHEARMGFLETYMEAFRTANATMEELTLRFFTNFIGWYQGAFATAAEQIVIDGKKASDVVHDLGMSFKRMLVRWAADYVAQQMVALAFSKTATTTATAIAKAAELSQLGTAVPLATAVSLYSWGANAPPAIAGMTSASTAAAGLFAPKMHSGGEVDNSGPGVGNERLRVLQRGEFVVANDKRNIQVSIPAGSGGNTYNVSVNVNANNIDSSNVRELAQELAEGIREELNAQVERGETLRASEVRAA